MATADIHEFPPLHGAIAQAESWTQYLANADPGDANGSAENIVWVGVHLGEMLPFVWRLTFHDVFVHGKRAWATAAEFDAIRQDVRRLFFTAREAMDRSRQVGEALQGRTGQRAAGMDRLLQAIAAARDLEESVFRAWPAFTDPLPSAGDSLPVDESLAQALGVEAAEARRKMDARRRELHTRKI